MKPRIIVCGLGRTGYQVFCLLKQQGAKVTGIHDRPLSNHEMPGDDILIGDMGSAATLLAAGIKEAQTLVLATHNDSLNLATLTQARVLNPKIRIINRLFNSSLGDRLDQTLPDHFSMSVAALAAPVFAFAASGNRAIGQLRLFNQIWPIHEELIDETHSWRGRRLSELWEDRSRMLIYYLPAHNQMDLVSAVVCNKHLQTGDRLIVASKPEMRPRHSSLNQRFFGFILGLRHFQRHVQPTVMITLILLLTIFAATLTYTTANSRISAIDALYFSVGLITGAGGNEGVMEQAPLDIKIFTVVMMLVGAAVIGLFYALLNDFVLGTRLQQFWNTARVPHRHHYVVCGLGGVGVQIIRQLRTNGCEVVVIERDLNNRFLNVARSLRVPVIHGEANLDTTLQAARLAGASALITVTSNDVTNLEIALTAKGIAPKIPVIVRSQNPQFAPLAQQVFEFEAVLSPADLAAPSFAAAALGGRILGNGMTAGILWVSIATVITLDHPFCGKRIKNVAMDADFVPLYLETKRQTTHGWNLLDVDLGVGDVLYLTIPAKNLEMLWRTEPIALGKQLKRSIG
ncbi:MAG: NAD-binding protein [Drouetiella hepatica Uher 2000/2452]|jgi:Trk K+ transport system NAD-binding subunit|uniref:NAD-binding protein n=1 Tax=Drouetiella hepatica Uher 2000/2452 TaxID=904376 RepID=A0A951UNH1_9CYAN|nr:NAD-binding protein [Drouetiella hepatica Uher 2000/2452]